MLLILRIKLIHTWAFIMCPSALGKLCVFPGTGSSVWWRSCCRTRASAEQESSTAIDSSCIRRFLVPPPFLSSPYLICLKSTSLTKPYSSEGEGLFSALFIVDTVDLWSGGLGCWNLSTMKSNFKICFQL